MDRLDLLKIGNLFCFEKRVMVVFKMGVGSFFDSLYKEAERITQTQKCEKCHTYSTFKHNSRTIHVSYIINRKKGTTFEICYIT